VIPLSLYIHFPWCVKKCPYCDFNSHVTDDPIPEEEYINALEADLQQDLGFIQGREVVSIFMGGGTPSLFSPGSIRRLLSRLQVHLTFSPNIEITVEANPGTTDYAKFDGYFQAGINRLSIGVQSFNDKQLNLLGRIHTQEDARHAFNAARKAGFTNINLDLMHGLEEQSVKDGLSDLQKAVDLNPTHLSWYQLTIEPNTMFHKSPPPLPSEDVLWEIYDSGIGLLQRHGFERYEVSAFSQPNRQSRHNINYWEFGDYLGIGAGAHAKLTMNDKIYRRSRTRLPKHYLARQNVLQTIVSEEDLLLEFLMNALRLNQGFSLDLFSQRTGLSATVMEPFLQTAAQRKLVTVSGEHVAPTTLGMQFLNDLLALV
jgi:oxygen-independent coproporphyrinogen-3 oxidase